CVRASLPACLRLCLCLPVSVRACLPACVRTSVCACLPACLCVPACLPACLPVWERTFCQTTQRAMEPCRAWRCGTGTKARQTATLKSVCNCTHAPTHTHTHTPGVLLLTTPSQRQHNAVSLIASHTHKGKPW